MTSRPHLLLEIYRDCLNEKILLYSRKFYSEKKFFFQSISFNKTTIKRLNEISYEACQNGQLKLIKYFLDMYMMDINVVLYLSCRAGNISLIKYLLNEVTQKSCEFALRGACREGHRKIIKFFLRRMMSPNLENSRNSLICFLTEISEEITNKQIIKYLKKKIN